VKAMTAAQEKALGDVARVVDASFYLAGGVAVAVHLGHRISRDLDLFSQTTDPTTLADVFVQQCPESEIVDRSPGTLHLQVAGVPVSAIRYAYPDLASSERIPGVPVPVASVLDLIAMKLSAIAGRGAARDFWDLHAMLAAEGKALAVALDAFRKKYVREDVGHVVRSLAYFADAEAEPMPPGLTPEIWRRIRADFEAWVRAV
jgi:hypothetical protein